MTQTTKAEEVDAEKTAAKKVPATPQPAARNWHDSAPTEHHHPAEFDTAAIGSPVAECCCGNR